MYSSQALQSSLLCIPVSLCSPVVAGNRVFSVYPSLALLSSSSRFYYVSFTCSTIGSLIYSSLAVQSSGSQRSGFCVSITSFAVRSSLGNDVNWWLN